MSKHMLVQTTAPTPEEIQAFVQIAHRERNAMLRRLAGETARRLATRPPATLAPVPRPPAAIAVCEAC